ncbi:hypothetical protein DUNSADRAFT_968 [Dunaliella salina]|uniref:Translation initiation factor eIF2B subunit delta n=1 Tax=Dunaliella salina TaxID=3046 RepID=A0ABQ7GXR4_DUNSA|nr:hypothetical protein DUNSADRAFT_968 [Dunaliella salina]|eukprot:KAF5839399.1 hypothetical protein DUNSADRAFT_968 [Dunaliella salina]
MDSKKPDLHRTSSRRSTHESQVEGAVPVPKTIVGFHVDGASPSPATEGLLSKEAGRSSFTEGGGSPTPVIIPPTFQRERFETREPTPQEGSAGASTGVAPAFGSVPAGSTSQQSGEGSIASGIPASARPKSLDLPAPDVPGPNTTQQQGNSGVVPPFVTSPAVVQSAVPGFEVGKPPQSQPAQPSAPPVHRSPSPAAAAPAAGVAPSSLHGFSVNSAQQQTQPQAQQAQPSLPQQQPQRLQQPPVQQPQKQQPQQPQQQGSSAPKLKEMSKAERRALQEAQRAAKAGGQKDQDGGSRKEGGGGGGGGASAGRAHSVASSESHSSHRGGAAGGKESKSAATGQKAEDKGAPAASLGDAAAKAPKRRPARKVVSLNSTELFAHLPPYQKVSVSSLLSHKDAVHMHPAVLQLGLRYADGTIKGATARCLAMLHTFCQVIQEYVTPPGKSLSRDLTHELNTIIDLLVQCRPLAVSMANTIRRLKMRIHSIDVNAPEAEAKRALIEDIRRYIEVQIIAADRLLVDCAVQKVTDGDVILTFAYSHIVANVLTKAAALGRTFKVMVVDCRPELEGQRMLEKLQASGIACSYIHLNALSFVVRDVTKVFLGAAAIMSNGTVMGRAGNAAVAMTAHAHSKPVLVCCESFKFHERVQLDSITHNELGDPDALVSLPGYPGVSPLAGWQDIPRLGLLNLKYDAMPAEYVTMIVTEYGMIPPTSVPVILREQQQDASASGGGGGM